MADLITSDRALYNLNNISPTVAEGVTIAALVISVSKAVRRFCKRDFDSQSYDELYSGNGLFRLLLRQFPIVSVQRVAYDPRSVLRIQNTNAANQRATVTVGSAGLTLVRVASGVSTTDTSVTFNTYTTVNALAAAINALGNGWSATVVDSTLGNLASADLRVFQGALNCAQGNQANIKIHTQELSAYEIDDNRGYLIKGDSAGNWYGAFGGTTQEDNQDGFGAVWFGGVNFWRVLYTAGFATVPEDVQEACAEWVAYLFKLTKRDPAVQGLVNSDATSQSYQVPSPGEPPPNARALLLPYRDHKIMNFGLA